MTTIVYKGTFYQMITEVDKGTFIMTTIGGKGTILNGKHR